MIQYVYIMPGPEDDITLRVTTTSEQRVIDADPSSVPQFHQDLYVKMTPEFARKLADSITTILRVRQIKKETE